MSKANPARRLRAVTAAPSSHWDPPQWVLVNAGREKAPLSQPHLHHRPLRGRTRASPGPGQGKGFVQGLAPTRARSAYWRHQQSMGGHWGGLIPTIHQGSKGTASPQRQQSRSRGAATKPNVWKNPRHAAPLWGGPPEPRRRRRSQAAHNWQRKHRLEPGPAAQPHTDTPSISFWEQQGKLPSFRVSAQSLPPLLSRTVPKLLCLPFFPG